MSNAHTDPNIRATVSGPGARLAQARMDQQLAHEDVAARLHLSSGQIEALEQDDYASLPGSTYVRGYLKSYALLLGLAPDPILEAYAQRTARPTVPDYRNIAPQKEITSRHHQVRFTTYLVVLIVLVLSIAWWQGRETRPPNPLLATPDGEGAAVNTEVAAAPAAAPVADPGQKPEAPAVAEVPVASAAKPQAPAAAAMPAAAPPVTAAPEAAAALPSGPSARIVLNMDQDSWADIRDARQVKLLYDTIPAGRSVTLEGVAPVSVFLGNAAGVRLDYNGKPVDVARHRRGMVARFVLGEEEAAVAPAH